ncbi:MAG: protein kinase, partial [Christensenellaceae bacterium]|nr:protein kinase [Christensenellaceae bacterium]
MDRVLSDRYELGEQIGTGGMAVVFEAYDRVKDRVVAIKALRSEFNEDAEFVRRFDMEAQAASKMSHPNIVAIYGVGQDGDVRYIVMEYVRGKTLKEVIRQSGRIKPERAVQIALKILAAVDCAHRSHVVHRDIKPQNILVDVEGNVKVADFGIARATNAATQTYADGNVLGSVHYFSPEQASGQVADEKSDLYSVGVVLYEMVTGEVPFDGETPISIALKHVQEAPRSARSIEPSVSKGLDEVILKSLDKEASCRYQGAAEMAADLKRAIRTPRGGFVDKPNIYGRERLIRQQMASLGKPGFWAKARVWVIAVASGALLFLLVYYGSQLYRQLFLRIEMPNLKMYDIEHAVANVEALGLEHVIQERHNDDVRLGYVIDQYPAAGESVWPGDRVQLTMSKGKEKLMMPKLLYMTRSKAVKLIEEHDLIL